MREITTDDIPDLVTLIEALGYEASVNALTGCITRYHALSHAWAYGIEREGRLVAAAAYHVTPLFHRPGALLRVTCLVVSDRYRRQGLGRELIEKAKQLAAAAGCDRIELFTGAHRAGEAHRFYERLGMGKYDGVRYLLDVGNQ